MTERSGDFSADDHSENQAQPPDPKPLDGALDATRAFDPETQASGADEILFDDVSLIEIQGAIPETLGKYTIQGQIGRGGMGVVYRAFDPALRRTVAIKVLGIHLAHSPTARRRFQREARAAAAISHPNVLTIHSVEEEKEVPFLVMEYVSGQSLKQHVALKGKLEPIEVIRLSTQIALGLAAAHAQGVIHRDVKPANVMLHEGATRVRLMDFGLARAAFDNSELTSHDHTVGTPAYMAPEQVRGSRIDARADLFSLGCVMYFMSTGHSPFQGRTQAETIHRIMSTNPPPLHDVNASTPPVLSDMIEKLLLKEPDQRYQSSLEVADELRRLMFQLNQTPTDELVEVLGDKTRSVRSAEEKKRGVSKWLTSRGGLATVGTALLLALTGGLATWNYWTSDTVRVPFVGDSQIQRTADQSPNGHAPLPSDPVKLTEITVGAGADATCATLTEAIRRAAPNCTITVVGPGTFVESVAVEGLALNGLTLKATPRVTWRCPDGNGSETYALQLKDVSNVRVEGFDFEVTSERGRAAHTRGTVGEVSFVDCSFRHSVLSPRLSLLNLGAVPETPESRTLVQNCRFKAGAGPCYCLAIDNSESSTSSVVCEACQFESDDKHVYVTKACRRFQLRNSIFIGGHTGMMLSFKPWSGDEQFDIVNNTFLGTKYWFSWMDSEPITPAPSGAGNSSRLCNNLILGGERTLGKNEQWDAMLTVWSCKSNWWERESITTTTADRNGRLAVMHDKLSVPERSDPASPNFLMPAADSPLMTSGVGGDLPTYIGARGPLR